MPSHLGSSPKRNEVLVATLDEDITHLEGILAQEDVEFAWTMGQAGGWVPLEPLTDALLWEALQLLLLKKQQEREEVRK